MFPRPMAGQTFYENFVSLCFLSKTLGHISYQKI